MLRLRLFGSVELQTAGGEEVRQLLAQPKRLALLAYLALAEPAGFHRRDVLLALFWPEADAESARRALRQSLHFLRANLGAAVLEGRGSEEVRVAPGTLWCDVLAFRECVASGQFGDALDLRRGELLPGFHVRDASSDFEEWLIHERARLRAAAAAAGRALAASEEGEGRLARALLAADRALELVPTDEATARTVMRLRHALGDSDGALELFHALERRLTEYDALPEPDTRALAQAIARERGARRADAGRVETTLAAGVMRPAEARANVGVTAAPPGPAPARAAAEPRGEELQPAADARPGTATPNDRDAPPVAVRGTAGRFRLGGWLAGALALGVAMVALGAFRVGPAAALFASRPPSERSLVVFTDFSATGDDSLLARVVSYALRDALSQSTALDVMTPSRVAETLDLMARERGTRLDLATAREVAQRDGGTAVLDGEVAQAGTGYVVTVRLVDAEADRVLATFQRAGDGPKGLMQAADELAQAVRRQAGESLREVQRAVPLRRARTASLEAARRFTEGAYANEVLVDWPLAARRFEEAIALDSAFAMAWLSLAMMRENLGAPPSQIVEAATRAHELRDRLPSLERLAVEGSYFARGRGRDREQALVRARLSPRSWGTAALLFRRRREFARADSTWRAGLASDSSSRLVMRNLAGNLLMQGKLREADSVHGVLERRFGADPGVAHVRVLRPLLEGDVAATERILDSLASKGGAAPPMRGARASVALMRGRLARWRALAAGPPDAMRMRWPGRVGVLDAATRAAIEVRIAGAAPALLDGMEQRLRAADLSSLPEPDRPYLPIAAALGWAGRADLAAWVLREYDRTVRDTSLRRVQLPDYQTAQATIALAERRFDEALSLVRRGDSLPDGPVHQFEARLPLALALTFDAAGRPDSAAHFFEQFLAVPMAGKFDYQLDAASVPVAHERLAALYEQLGRPERAAHHARAFVTLWGEADRELQPRVDAARARLVRLDALAAGRRVEEAPAATTRPPRASPRASVPARPLRIEAQHLAHARAVAEVRDIDRAVGPHGDGGRRGQ